MTGVQTCALPISSANPGSSFYSSSTERPLNVSNGVELNYVLVESGFIEVEIFSEIKENIIVTYSIPSATKNGDTLVLKELVNAATLSQNGDRKSTRLNSSHTDISRMPSSA